MLTLVLYSGIPFCVENIGYENKAFLFKEFIYHYIREDIYQCLSIIPLLFGKFSGIITNII